MSPCLFKPCCVEFKVYLFCDHNSPSSFLTQHMISHFHFRFARSSLVERGPWTMYLRTNHVSAGRGMEHVSLQKQIEEERFMVFISPKC